MRWQRSRVPTRGNSEKRVSNRKGVGEVGGQTYLENEGGED